MLIAPQRLPVGVGGRMFLPPPPPPPALLPDIALHFRPCLDERVREVVRNLMVQAMAIFSPNPDVRIECTGDTTKLVIFLSPNAPGTPLDQQRAAAVQRLNLLRAGEGLGTFISSSALNQMVAALMQRGTIPTSVDSFRITGISVFGQAPDRVVTVIRGFYELPILPDPNFQIFITDQLITNNGRLECRNLAFDPRADRGLLDLITGGLVGGLFSLFFGPAGIFVGILAGTRVPGVLNTIAGALAGPEAQMAGLGCRLAKVANIQLLVPGGMKLSLRYTRAQADVAGLSFGGIAMLEPRTPSVTISSFPLMARQGATTANGVFSAITSDLREPLTFAWTAAPGGTVISPNAPQTLVTFRLTGRELVGSTVTSSVGVTVTDADFLRASATAPVRIEIVSPDFMRELCLRNPRLAICNPGPGRGPG